jgi:hypothetical protein
METIEIHDSDSKFEPHVINKMMNDGKHLFIFFYLENCQPCKLTKEPWRQAKCENSQCVKMMVNQALVNDVDDSPVLDKKGDIKFDMQGFPFIVYVHQGGEGKAIVEPYEGGRTPEAFEKWIESKSGMEGGRRRRRNRKRTRRGRSRRLRRGRGRRTRRGRNRR